ncbi:hypothetical protein ACIGCM_00395 [Pseudomonas sp. NPDC078700]|uniref:hypothetical protein n=1 Tax=Pseudomonas sp. NPDC078700 TaxID=3364424 RepID=UPI0037CCB4A3
MFKSLRTVHTAIAFTAAIACSGQALASHHFESRIVQKTPTLNQLDNFVFASERPDHTVFVMTFSAVPKAGVDGALSTHALYNIHVANDEAYKTGHTYSVSYTGDDEFSLYAADAPNVAAGTKGAKLTDGRVGKTTELENGIKVWTGVVKDPFYGNSTSLGLLRAQLHNGTAYDPSIWAQAQGKSIFIGRKAAAIVLDVPNSMLGSSVRVFMTTDAQKNGAWQQVQYSANPLISHTMLFENGALKAQLDGSRPDTQKTIKSLISARITRATLLANSQKDPIKYADKVADMLIPDVLTYKVGTAAKYAASERNGRSLDDDAMSAVLTMLLGTPTDQKISNPKLHTPGFPYLVPTTVD